MSKMNSRLKSVVLSMSVVALIAAVGCGGVEPEAEQAMMQVGAVLPLEPGPANDLSRPSRLDDPSPCGELGGRDQLHRCTLERAVDARAQLDRDNEELSERETRQGRGESSSEDIGARQGRFERALLVEMDQLPPRVELPERTTLGDSPRRGGDELGIERAPARPSVWPGDIPDNSRGSDDDDDDDGR